MAQTLMKPKLIVCANHFCCANSTELSAVAVGLTYPVGSNSPLLFISARVDKSALRNTKHTPSIIVAKSSPAASGARHCKILSRTH